MPKSPCPTHSYLGPYIGSSHFKKQCYKQSIFSINDSSWFRNGYMTQQARPARLFQQRITFPGIINHSNNILELYRCKTIPNIHTLLFHLTKCVFPCYTQLYGNSLSLKISLSTFGQIVILKRPTHTR